MFRVGSSPVDATPKITLPKKIFFISNAIKTTWTLGYELYNV